MANAKPTFAKLKLQKNIEKKVITFNDFEIEVKQYLPIQEKMELVARVINYCIDENNFINPIKIDVFGTLEIIFAYSNISFTDKQKENVGDLYDALISSGLADLIIQSIPQIEYTGIINYIEESISNICSYKNSFMGVLEQVSNDYNAIEFDANKIQQTLADPNNLDLLKAILTKLG